MISIKRNLLKKGYIKVPLKVARSNHFVFSVRINGVKGRFILDTGASNSCINLSNPSKFNLHVQDTATKASGAGANDMITKISHGNTIEIKTWIFKKLSIVLFDLQHVNKALEMHDIKAIDGIIGADILKKGEAVIDYNKKRVYLKRLLFKY